MGYVALYWGGKIKKRIYKKIWRLHDQHSQNSAVDEFKETVHKVYTEKTGYSPSFYITSADEGTREVK